MMKIISCFSGMVDRRKAFSLISSLDHPPGQIYVRGIFVEHSHDIFPEYSERVPHEIPGIFPNNVPGIFFVECSWNITMIYSQNIRKSSIWNSGEYSQIMFRKYWIQEYSLIVPWISYECYMHVFRWIKKYNSG